MDVTGFLWVSLGSSTVQVHGSLGSRRECTCSEAGFSSQNGDRAWGVCCRRAASCCALFGGQNNSMQRIFINKYVPFTARSVCRVKRFTTASRNSLKDVRKSQMMPSQVRKWLRQQSKDFYATGFDALVKRLICREIYIFLGSNITCFTFIFTSSYSHAVPRYLTVWIFTIASSTRLTSYSEVYIELHDTKLDYW
jgi:hypothetical protein